jgi:hypothetical protein
MSSIVLYRSVFLPSKIDVFRYGYVEYEYCIRNLLEKNVAAATLIILFLDLGSL